MKIQYLGTGAAEGIPALFCQCRLCREAGRLGGRAIRTRAGAVVNDRVLLDITPDLYLQKLRFGLDLSRMEGAIVTHSHTDHFDSAELTRRSAENYCHIEGGKRFFVYGNEKVVSLGKQGLMLEFGKETDSSIEFRPIKAYEGFSFAGLEFIPLPAAHDKAEECFVYLIREGEKTGLYGNDTGLWKEEDYDYLKGISLDLVSLDCTFGPKDGGFSSHMGFKQNGEFLKELKKRGCIGENTRVFANHFSHNCGLNHEELKKEGKKWGIIPAYDGLTVEW